MESYQLALKKALLPKSAEKQHDNTLTTLVEYERLDQTHFSFSYSVDDNIDIRMDESESFSSQTGYYDAEYVAEPNDNTKALYSLAFASGVITGAFNSLPIKEDQLSDPNELKEKDWRKIILYAANIAGYKKTDYKGAVKFLISHAISSVNKNEQAKEAVSRLSSHPSSAGLIFSVISQFTEKQIDIDDSGEIVFSELPDYYTIGKTNAEKMVCACLYWLFSLAADELRSRRHVLEQLNLPKPLLSLLRDVVDLPIMDRIPTSYNEAETVFSEWCAKVVRQERLAFDGGQNEKRVHPIVGAMGLALNLAEESFMVLINECIVRGIFIMYQLCSEIRIRQIKTIEDIDTRPVENLLPVSGQLLSRMSLIASGSFVAMNIVVATARAVRDKKVKGRKFANAFFTELNIIGIGRFLFAVAEDSKYWGDGIKIMFRRKNPEGKNDGNNNAVPDEASVFDSLTLDEAQARILYCLENIAIQYDIVSTKDNEDRQKKEEWVVLWKSLLAQGIGIADELVEDYFVVDEDLIYNGIYQLAQNKENWKWFYLLTQELALFEGYFPLGLPDDSRFKGLKMKADYVADQFVRRQTIVSQAEVDQIIKSYSKYKGLVSGKTQNSIIGVSAAAIIAIASGGAAFMFAPGIAAAIAGEAVGGLHGAALTSASLAFVGGGSLAAGGLGVAGGTAIITGGGALLGLVSSGGASATAILLQTSNDYWVRQSAKLLTYSKCVLDNFLNDEETVNYISDNTEKAVKTVELAYQKLREEDNDLDKTLIKRTSDYLKYLKKCNAELKKIAKK